MYGLTICLTVDCRTEHSYHLQLWPSQQRTGEVEMTNTGKVKAGGLHKQSPVHWPSAKHLTKLQNDGCRVTQSVYLPLKLYFKTEP